MDHFGAGHCEICRKWSGRPYMKVEFRDGIEIEGEENVSIGIFTGSIRHVSRRLKIFFVY